jgi:hypothetical protein
MNTAAGIVFTAFGLVMGVSVSAAESEFECSTTPVEDRLPDLVAPMAGKEPIWLVDGSFGRWAGPEVLVKSVWVLSREVAGDLTVEGRRLDGAGVMRFQDDRTGSRAARLVIPEARERSVQPGGSTPEVLDRYAFVMMYLVYPSAGCWELKARLGEIERRIVVELAVGARDDRQDGGS